jgi:uncharacterized membrane protein
LERPDGRSVAVSNHKEKIMPNALALFEVPQNMSAKERAISAIAGLGLAAAGAKPRPNRLLNIFALLGGAFLAIRGATGRCPVKQALQSAPMRMVPARAKAPAKRSRGGRR